LLPGRPGHVGRNSDKGNRLFVEAVIWKFSTGAPWRDLPERFGDWKNTHKRSSRWAENGVWESLFKILADDPDNEYARIDATVVRAHQHTLSALASPFHMMDSSSVWRKNRDGVVGGALSENRWCRVVPRPSVRYPGSSSQFERWQGIL
jgi:transposase